MWPAVASSIAAAMLIVAALIALAPLAQQAASLATAPALELAHAAAAMPRWMKQPSGGWWWSAPLVELRRRHEAGERFDSDVWRVLLVDGGYLKWRKDALLTEPFHVELCAPPLGRNGFTVVLVPRVESWPAVRATNWELMCGMMDSRTRKDLGQLLPLQREVRFDVHAGYASGRAPDRSLLLPERVGDLTLEVRPRERLDEILTPFADFAVSRAIARELRLSVGQNEHGGARSQLFIVAPPWPRSLACDCEVELLRDGRLVSVQSLLFDPSSSQRFASCVVEGLSPRVVRGDASSNGWTLRLRGAPGGARRNLDVRNSVLRNWEATHYWAGSIELALNDVPRAGGGSTHAR